MRLLQTISICLLCIVPEAAAQLYEVHPLPINTTYADEVATAIFGNSLIYCSNRNSDIIFSLTDDNGEHLFQLYDVQHEGQRWGTPVLLYRDKRKEHQGPGTVSPDGKTLYFTINNEKAHGIFIAQRTSMGWGTPVPFAHNNRSYRTAHPSLSADGKRLFFVSDMPGGSGGFDIYCSTLGRSGWGRPKNLGKQVNTAADELYPFIQADGTLFFSSLGYPSTGGFDIYSTREVDGVWQEGRPLAPPINSTSDDFAYIASDGNGSNGYFSSRRSGKSIDMYAFTPLFPAFAQCSPQEENDYTYEFFEPSAMKLDTTTFYYVWHFGDGDSLRGEQVEHTYSATGHYSVVLNVVDSLTGTVQSRAAEYDLDVTDIEQPYITAPEKVKPGETVVLSSAKTYLPEVNIENYYWTLGDGTRIIGKNATHSYSAAGTYQITLAIMGTRKGTSEKVTQCVSRSIEVRK